MAYSGSFSKDNHSAFTTDSHEGESNEYIEDYLKELDKLRKLHFEKNLEANLFKKSMVNLHFAEFLFNHMFTPCSHEKEYNISKKEQRYIEQLLLEKEKLNQAASKISKENRALEKQVIEKKVLLKDSIKKRKKLWNAAARMYMLITGKLADLELLDLSYLFEDIDDQQKSKERELRDLTEGMNKKAYRIVVVSRILHNLICFSGMSWATDKNLLKIILTTGNILGNCFSFENQRDFRKTIDEAIVELNCVKL